MTKLSYRLHKTLQVAFLSVGSFAAANYYMELGFFGRAAKGVMLGIMIAFVVYAAYFVPSLHDERSVERKE
jgi:hypothetical protein